ncbi:MAG TPA: hypothetical protein VFV22_00815 [Candidatus Paceibacterota bacterium]|nr:hypothetical protein [Candidatus Paceibacterota bacterium]
MEILMQRAIQNIRDTISHALEYVPTHAALIFYDTDTPLADILTNAYRVALPQATFVHISHIDKERAIEMCDALEPRDLVILVQSTDFRLNDFRIRIYLFQKKLKVIEHRHLARHPEHTWNTYINALAYDPTWYRKTGHALKHILEHSSKLMLHAPDTTLTISSGLEIPKLNVGDYTNMENIGGTFPIGEVFTEAKELHAMCGSLTLYAFADTHYLLQTFEPFRVDIDKGLLIGWSSNTPQAFIDVVDMVQAQERPIFREIGFGLNRAITRATPLHDITAFERTLGIHLSLGEKHTVYKKEGIHADKTRFHVDVFPIITSVYADERLIFDGETYIVS